MARLVRIGKRLFSRKPDKDMASVSLSDISEAESTIELLEDGTSERIPEGSSEWETALSPLPPPGEAAPYKG